MCTFVAMLGCEIFGADSVNFIMSEAEEAKEIERKESKLCKRRRSRGLDQLGNGSSRTITEVKQHWARLVLEWETPVQVLPECCC